MRIETDTIIPEKLLVESATRSDRQIDPDTMPIVDTLRKQYGGNGADAENPSDQDDLDEDVIPDEWKSGTFQSAEETSPEGSELDFVPFASQAYLRMRVHTVTSQADEGKNASQLWVQVRKSQEEDSPSESSLEDRPPVDRIV